MPPASDAKELPLLLAQQQRTDLASFTVVEAKRSVLHVATCEGNCNGTGACAEHSESTQHLHDEPRQWLDRLGIALSTLCAIHCAATPLLVAFAPFLFTAEFESRTKVLLVSLAAVALGWGFVSHRSWKPIAWLGVALTAFGVAEVLGHGGAGVEHSGHGEWLEVGVSVVASIALILAHVANTRACRTAGPHDHGLPFLSRRR
jgi:hypothetical protein